MVKEGGENDMKKYMSILLTVMLVLSLLVPMQAVAASYPEIYMDYTATTWTIPEGEVGSLVFIVEPAYTKESYTVILYTEDGEALGAASDVIYNTTMEPQAVAIEVDTAELNMTEGVYLVEYYMEYYYSGQWNYAPESYVEAFAVISDKCGGDHEFELASEVIAPTCSEEGQGFFVCVDCEHLVYDWIPTVPHTYEESVVLVPPTPTTEGERTYICTECGEAVAEVIPTTAAVKITKQPKTAYANNGGKVKVSVAATGDGLTYQWYVRNANEKEYKKSSVTKASYSTTMTEESAERRVYCIVTDEYGNTEQSKTVMLRMKASITDQPQDAVTTDGKTVSTTVGALGKNLTYQWYVKNPGKTTFSKSSVTKATYSCTMKETVDGRQVYCVVSDTYGNSVKSDVATLTMADPVKITTQPKTGYAQSGKTVKVTVAAEGDGLTYQWYIRNANKKTYTKSSVTSATYSATMKDSVNGRRAYCIITDQYGNSVQSKTVVLRMAATIITQPADASAASGASVSTKVEAVGNELTYQWYVKNPGKTTFAKSSVTSDTYTCTMKSSIDGRQVYCVVTDSYGKTAKSAVATLTME